MNRNQKHSRAQSEPDPGLGMDTSTQQDWKLKLYQLFWRGRGEHLPLLGEASSRWKHWVVRFSPTLCLKCFRHHGTIYPLSLVPVPDPKPLVHPRCHCKIKRMHTIFAGTATIDLHDGADFWLKHTRHLPDFYIDKNTAKRKYGWSPKAGDLEDVLPGYTIGGDIYKNNNNHLPLKEGRIWYEADINYRGGYRKNDRIVYSNDGLMFVTYDHFSTFYEIK